MEGLCLLAHTVSGQVAIPLCHKTVCGGTMASAEQESRARFSVVLSEDPLAQARGVGVGSFGLTLTP